MAKAAKVLLALVLGAGALRKHRGKADVNTTSMRPVLLPGQIDVKRPAFLMLDGEKNRVLVSQFGFNTKPDTFNPIRLPAQSSITGLSLKTLADQVSARRLSGGLRSEDFVVSTNSPLRWPNKLDRAPYGDFIVVPDGFLPPGKRTGELFLARPDGSVFPISKTAPATFYHEVEWIDFDGDGLLDILTARCKTIGTFKISFEGEMVWLKNPGLDKMDKQVWQETSITAGPDVIFKSYPYKGGYAIFCTEFFNAAGPKLTVRFLNSAGVQQSSRVIDDNLGKPFAVMLEDVDGDGKKELLVTNHQGPDDEILPAVFAYEVDWNNLESGAYPRHTLTYGPSENKVSNVGVGAPGFAHSFYPRAGMTGPKWVFAAGDGAYDVWILKPTGRRFEYETLLIDINGTTGEILAHDFDGDGIMDLLIPDNDYWKLHVITFE